MARKLSRRSFLEVALAGGALGTANLTLMKDVYAQASGPIVIAQLDGGLGAVQVDRIGERMDVILKPLEGLLSGVPGLAGSTLLGDGSVLLVLDLGELVR